MSGIYKYIQQVIAQNNGFTKAARGARPEDIDAYLKRQYATGQRQRPTPIYTDGTGDAVLRGANARQDPKSNLPNYEIPKYNPPGSVTVRGGTTQDGKRNTTVSVTQADGTVQTMPIEQYRNYQPPTPQQPTQASAPTGTPSQSPQPQATTGTTTPPKPQQPTAAGGQPKPPTDPQQPSTVKIDTSDPRYRFNKQTASFYDYKSHQYKSFDPYTMARAYSGPHYDEALRRAQYLMQHKNDPALNQGFVRWQQDNKLVNNGYGQDPNPYSVANYHAYLSSIIDPGSSYMGQYYHIPTQDELLYQEAARMPAQPTQPYDPSEGGKYILSQPNAAGVRFWERNPNYRPR